MPSKSLMFKYDGLDRRIEKQFVDFKNSKNSYTKRFVYDEEDIILELDGNNAVKALFVHGEGIDDPLMMIRDENDNQIFEDKEVYAYTKDHLGSIREIVDYNGETKQRYSYSSYGETKIAKVNPKDEFIDSPYAYTSRELDLESGDMFYRARYYSPSEGRFVSEDPIEFLSGDVNFYRYVENKPLDTGDPSGNGPILGGICYLADIAGNMGTGAAEFYNQSNIASIYEQDRKNAEHQLKNCGNDDVSRARLNSKANLAKLNRNAALAKGSKAIMSSIGTTIAGGVICKGVMSLPGL